MRGLFGKGGPFEKATRGRGSRSWGRGEGSMTRGQYYSLNVHGGGWVRSVGWEEGKNHSDDRGVIPLTIRPRETVK